MRAARVVAVAAVGLVLAAGSIAPRPATAQQARPAPSVRHEIDGRINGRDARFAADGDNVLLSTAEADRLGIDYRSGRKLAIGDVTLWLVSLNSVTVDKRTRLVATAGVVANIPAYFAALQAHAAEALARSREVEVQIDGQTAGAFDLGEHLLLLSFPEANRLGLRFVDGERRTIGAAETWRLELPVKRHGNVAKTTVIVGEPALLFDRMQAEIDAQR